MVTTEQIEREIELYSLAIFTGPWGKVTVTQSLSRSGRKVGWG